jgi:hypothetical protein
VPLILARHSAAEFVTCPLNVEADADGLRYSASARQLNFVQMQQGRRPIEIADAQVFSTELANLGVSVQLTLEWQDRDFWVVVRQHQPEQGDQVLKLISGYVPQADLEQPLKTALQEVSEECLIETEQGWLAGIHAQQRLDQPYCTQLDYCREHYFELQADMPAATRKGLKLVLQPLAYVHTATASLQLVYRMRLSLPRETRQPSLYHVDEQLAGKELLTCLDRRRQDIFLLGLERGKPTGELLTLRRGQLRTASTRKLWMSERFCPQEGWLIHQQRIRWSDWLQTLQ